MDKILQKYAIIFLILQAAVMLFLLWAYVTLIAIPPFFGWGGYGMEGVMVTCSYDYLKDVSMVSSTSRHRIFGSRRFGDIMGFFK